MKNNSATSSFLIKEKEKASSVSINYANTSHEDVCSENLRGEGGLGKFYNKIHIFP